MKEFFLFASASPMTGDGMGQLLWIGIVALVVSLVVIVAIAVLSGKNRRNRRK